MNRGLELTGEGGLLARLTKRVVESALEGELDDHLGYAKHVAAGRDGGNSRNGTRAKTVLTEAGPVSLDVPRDRAGQFQPAAGQEAAATAVRARRDGDLAVGQGTHSWRDLRAPGRDLRRASVQADHLRSPTGCSSEWQNRPLDVVYPVIFIDAVNVKIREGNVANRPIYVALAVTVEGTREVLGLWAGEHGDGEGAKYWMRVLSEIKNRGTADVCPVVCDGLKGLPEAIETVWPQAITQACVVHLLRNSFRYASKRDWAAIAKDLKPIYTAPSESAALEAFAEFSGKWEKRYPAIIKLWENAWAEFVPFLRFDVEIRTLVCTRSRASTRASAGP